MVNKPKKQIIGRHEYIDFPDFNFFNIKAKIDSGAYHGSINSSDKKEEIINGENFLSFILLEEKSKEYTGERVFVKEFKKVKIFSSNNTSEVRYVIPVKFRLGDQTFVSEFSLSSRGDRKVPILLGRENIRGHFIIDVSKTFILGKKRI